MVMITWALQGGHSASPGLLFANLQVGRPVFSFPTALTEMAVSTVYIAVLLQ